MKKSAALANQQLGKLPPDLANPPAFVRAVEARKKDDNPATYDGAKVGEMQKAVIIASVVNPFAALPHQPSPSAGYAVPLGAFEALFERRDHGPREAFPC